MTIPKELYEEIKKYNCVLFTGAGISTEGVVLKIYHEPTFYERIKQICKPKKKLPFPDLMQYYCDKIDGGMKNRLIREIINRIEYFSEFGEIYSFTTMFHKELASIPYFRIIVTTNWDVFLERELNILVPIVEDKDIPFWDENKRQILKIHGCVTRPYTIVATSKDYTDCIKEKSDKPIFNKLKDLMATKTFIFVGYSMHDPDIHIIFDQLINSLGNFARLSYAIDFQPSEEVIKNWKKRKVKILKLNVMEFMRELNKKLTKEEIIPDPEFVQFYWGQRSLIATIHTAMVQNTEKSFLSSMYQDGLLHELDYIRGQCQLGVTIKELKDKYSKNLKELDKCKEEKNPVEIAYWKGRIEAMTRFLSKKLGVIPLFFDPKDMKPCNEL